MEIRGYADGDDSSIPTHPGLYAFYLDALSPSRVGLLGRHKHSQEELEKAKSNTIARVEKILRFMRGMEATGVAKNSDKSGAPSTEYSVQLRELVLPPLLNDLRALPLDELTSFLRVAKRMPLFCQPIYVGITKNQTLYDRYQQHRFDYESNHSKNTFGFRLREARFDWDEVLFACVKMDIGDKSVSVLRILERHLQALSKPILSLA